MEIISWGYGYIPIHFDKDYRNQFWDEFVEAGYAEGVSISTSYSRAREHKSRGGSVKSYKSISKSSQFLQSYKSLFNLIDHNEIIHLTRKES